MIELRLDADQTNRRRFKLFLESDQPLLPGSHFQPVQDSGQPGNGLVLFGINRALRIVDMPARLLHIHISAEAQVQQLGVGRAEGRKLLQSLLEHKIGGQALR